MTNLPNISDHESKLEQLFGNLPAENEVMMTLPSLGKFYHNKSPEVKVRPIKFDDEKQLAVALKNSQNPINLILDRCLTGVDIPSLLVLDKMAILLKIREISYGADYPASVVCQKCNTTSEIKINLASLNINKVPDEVTDPREIELPVLKKKVVVRFPRVSDEQYIDDIKQTYDNLYRFILEFDGNKNPVFINKALNHEKMPIQDVKFIIKNISRQDLGLNPRFILDCGTCGAESEMEVPMNSNFFSVT